MESKFLESSEFYTARFKNFTTLLIIPSVILVLCVLIFSLVGKKEIAVKGIGTIEPLQGTTVIQTFIGGKLKENLLDEGKIVKPGMTILRFDNSQVQQKLNLAQKQNSLLTEQIRDIRLLQTSVAENRDLFSKEDNFGYQERLKTYLSQRNSIQIELEELKDKATLKQEQRDQLAKVQSDAFSREKQQLKIYQQLYQDIQNEHEYTANDSGKTIYQSYQTRRNMLENAEREQLKAETLKDLQKQIDDTNTQLDSIETQKIQQKDVNTSEAEKKGLLQKLQTLQTEQLSDISQLLNKLLQEQSELQANIKTLNNENDKYVVKATKAGRLHVIQEYVGVKSLGGQIQVAKIYPELVRNAEIKAYIPENEISTVKVGQMLKFKLTKNISKPLLLEGKVTKIATAPTQVDKNNYYTVVAKVRLSKTEAMSSKYGMSGSVSIVTGKETFFNYFKNKVVKEK